MGLEFGRDVCGQLPLAERREWLVTNGLGGYACGTVAGLLTRHYHGLLNAALKPPVDRTLLLTKLDEAVDYDGRIYQLHCDRWSTGSVSPKGYLYLERFLLEGTIPTWWYVFEDALLVKQVWMEWGANTTYIRYQVKRASVPIQLSVKALVNYRNHHHSTRSHDWQMTVEAISSGIAITAFEEAIPFYVISDRGHCTQAHQWYQGYDLSMERYRGIDPYDDHLHAATFNIQLAAEESITIAATTESPETIQLRGAIARRQQHEQRLLAIWHTHRNASAQPVPAWIEQLALAVDQFIVSRTVKGEPQGKTVIAGYPWFGDWGRDTMIALPGLAIATGRTDIARPILRTFAKYIDQGMLPNVFPEAGETPGYNTVDATLWYFEALRLYHAASRDSQLIKELFPVLVDIIRWHRQGTRYHIHQADDGLIAAGEAGVQLTWMDAKVNDWVVTPRYGKPIEVNALWYNALLVMAQFAQLLEKSAADYQQMAAHTRRGFQRFWSDELGYCYDVLDGPDGNDSSLRPNQILAVALPATLQSQQQSEPLLTATQSKAVVDAVARRLLTSYGLRSLDPDHPDYCGHYGGDRVQRDGAYHQGTVWGWLIGPFVQAHLQVYHDPQLAHSFLKPFADHLHDGCVGTLSEIFDGDAPFTPRGAYAQAWSVAEVLRAWCMIQDIT